LQLRPQRRHRAALGCPSTMGSWSRPFAKNIRAAATELDR